MVYVNCTIAEFHFIRLSKIITLIVPVAVIFHSKMAVQFYICLTLFTKQTKNHLFSQNSSNKTGIKTIPPRVNIPNIWGNPNIVKRGE